MKYKRLLKIFNRALYVGSVAILIAGAFLTFSTQQVFASTNGNGVGNGNGNCGQDSGIGNGGQDNGFGNGQGNCGTPVPTTVIPRPTTVTPIPTTVTPVPTTVTPVPTTGDCSTYYSNSSVDD